MFGATRTMRILAVLTMAGVLGLPQTAVGQDLPLLIVLDEDALAPGLAPTFFSDDDLNTELATVGLREQLPVFAGNIGQSLAVSGGTLSDQGWFAMSGVPPAWVIEDGEALENLVDAGPGLGSPDDNGSRTALLSAVPYVTPLQTAEFQLLMGRRVCGVVFAGDINLDASSLANLDVPNLGLVAFEVTSTVAVADPAWLPDLQVNVLDAEDVCAETPIPLGLTP
jgi:hypothetical protein